MLSYLAIILKIYGDENGEKIIEKIRNSFYNSRYCRLHIWSNYSHVDIKIKNN